MRPPAVIDMDPGIDDVLALAYAVGLGAFDLRAITTVTGNAPGAQTHLNARRAVSLLGIEREVPVFGGCVRPLVRPPQHGDVHGDDGVGGVELSDAGVPRRPEHAVYALVDLARRHAGELLVVATGPLTNVAVALSLEPGLPGLVDRLVIMGGAVKAAGNVSPAAEFNAYFDPEAADAVLAAGFDYTLVGLDATRRALLRHGDVSAWDESSPVQRAARRMVKAYLPATGGAGAALHDPLAAAVASDVGWVRTALGRVFVETTSTPTRGRTVFLEGSEASGADARRPGRVAIDLARTHFAAHFVEVIGRL